MVKKSVVSGEGLGNVHVTCRPGELLSFQRIDWELLFWLQFHHQACTCVCGGYLALYGMLCSTIMKPSQHDQSSI